MSKTVKTEKSHYKKYLHLCLTTFLTWKSVEKSAECSVCLTRMNVWSQISKVMIPSLCLWNFLFKVLSSPLERPAETNSTNEILRCLQNPSISYSHILHVFLLLAPCSPFPPHPLLPIICQNLCRFLALKTCCIQNLRPSSLPSTPPSPLLHCLKMDDLNLIWRGNISRSLFLSICLALSFLQASLKVDLTGRRGAWGWRVRECVRSCFLVSLLSSGYLCLCMSVYCMCV